MYDWFKTRSGMEDTELLTLREEMEIFYFNRKGQYVKRKTNLQNLFLLIVAPIGNYFICQHMKLICMMFTGTISKILIEVQTDNKCHILSVVEGSAIWSKQVMDYP